MREGFDAPTLPLPPEDVSALRAFFDGQSRVKLAVWVRHEQRGVDGPLYDHHLVVGVEDDDYLTGDMWALELGMPLPPLYFGEPQWIPDIFPLSEVQALRSFATVVWEGSGKGDDPLDYRLTWDPVEAEPEGVSRFAELLSSEPGIKRVEAARERLWKGDEEIKSSLQLFVEAVERRDALAAVRDAARAAGILDEGNFGSMLSIPRDPRVQTATLYEAIA